MARPIAFVRSEIVRVSKELGLPVRDPRFTRKKFLDNSEVTKWDIQSYGGFAALKLVAATKVAGEEMPREEKDRRGTQLSALAIRKAERNRNTEEYYREQFNEHLKTVFTKGSIRTCKASKSPRIRHDKKVLTALWSDLHFGVDVNPKEILGGGYNWEIAANRMGYLCQRVAERSEGVTTLRIVLDGDIMQGVIHLDDFNIKPMAEQIWGAAHILINCIDWLRMHFPRIEVVCLPGNHDRMTYRSKSRALAQRWDSHAHSLFLAIKMAFRFAGDVSFDVPLSGIALMDDLNGGCILACHGDTQPDPSNVSKSINVGNLNQLLYQIQQNNAIEEPISAALFGHWHTPTLQMLPSGAYVVVNGCLIGAEPFGQNGIGQFNTEPSQVMFDTVKGNVVTNFEVVKVRPGDWLPQDICPPPDLFEDGQLSLDA